MTEPEFCPLCKNILEYKSRSLDCNCGFSFWPGYNDCYFTYNNLDFKIIFYVDKVYISFDNYESNFEIDYFKNFEDWPQKLDLIFNFV